MVGFMSVHQVHTCDLHNLQQDFPCVLAVSNKAYSDITFLKLITKVSNPIMNMCWVTHKYSGGRSLGYILII